MKLLIVSTSTVYGQGYLQYLTPEITTFFRGYKRILFVPYARPSGISHEDYTEKACSVFEGLRFIMKGAHEFDKAEDANDWADGFFVGGGNTFLLLKKLYETGLLPLIDAKVRAGAPYMGTSAGCNLSGISIGTTNDMPIVQPPVLKAFGWLPFNINPHYLDPIPKQEHMGESRETRIAEFHHFNAQPVLGLREGSWLKLTDDYLELKGLLTARLFKKDESPVELKPGRLTGLL